MDPRQHLEIGGFHGLSESVRTALSYAVDRMEADHGCRQGTTALFWHLVGVVQQHREDLDPKKPPQNAEDRET